MYDSVAEWLRRVTRNHMGSPAQVQVLSLSVEKANFFIFFYSLLIMPFPSPAFQPSLPPFCHRVFSPLIQRLAPKPQNVSPNITLLQLYIDIYCWRRKSSIFTPFWERLWNRLKRLFIKLSTRMSRLLFLYAFSISIWTVIYSLYIIRFFFFFGSYR